MNKRRGNLSTAGAQTLRKSSLSPVTPIAMFLPTLPGSPRAPKHCLRCVRKCDGQEGGRWVLPWQYSAAAHHSSSNRRALSGSGLLATTSDSETILKQEPIPGVSVTSVARGFLPAMARTLRGGKLSPHPRLWSQLPPPSPAPPTGPWKAFVGSLCPGKAYEQGPRAAGLSLELGHVCHCAPLPSESFPKGLWFNNTEVFFLQRAW